MEAHFAGTRDECLTFVQRFCHVPKGARIAERDMSGLQCSVPVCAPEVDETSVLKQPLAAWPVTNAFQRLLYTNCNLPDACVQLAPAQERVAITCPPLVIESRSGTGKTLVLLQHAACQSNFSAEAPVLFVTVSPRLCKLLQQKYEEMNLAENLSLPPMQFFSFQAVLHQLLQAKMIEDFTGRETCRFPSYVNQELLTSR